MKTKTKKHKHLFTSKRPAFTLAEILITLGVIGVVAAVTLPSMVTNYKHKTYISGLQKFYSQFPQTMLAIKRQTGCEDMVCMGFSGSINEQWVENLKEKIRNNYKAPVFCYGTTDCEYEFFFINGNSGGKTFTASEFSFKTVDGFIIKIAPFSGQWASLTVDINGNKRPNTIGRDIHLFRISSTGEVYPYYGYKYAQITGASRLYWRSNSNLCNPTLANAGASYGCTARLIEEGWKMNY